jgi:hypothetical protein
MNPNSFNLSQAAYVYGLANTPLFLVRKLQEDPSIRAIADACTGEEIVSELRRIIGDEPTNACDAVRPYAYLVALSFGTEIDHLNEASRLRTSVYQWYGYIAETLVAAFSPVQKQFVQVPGVLPTPPVSQEVGTATTTRLIIAPQ